MQDICGRTLKDCLPVYAANICLKHNIMSREIKTNSLGCTYAGDVLPPYLYISLFIYVQKCAAITLASRQLCKRYVNRKRAAEFVHFSFICCKTRRSLSPWGRGSKQGEAHCKFMGHLLAMQTNRSQDNTSFVILSNASHSEQNDHYIPSLHLFLCWKGLKARSSPEEETST